MHMQPAAKRPVLSVGEALIYAGHHSHMLQLHLNAQLTAESSAVAKHERMARFHQVRRLYMLTAISTGKAA